MHQPGVEVRPLRQMNGASSFCEVFLTEARVRADRVVGELDGGWRVAQTTLFHERNSVAGGALPGLVAARSGGAGDLDRTVGQVVERSRAIAARQSTVRSGAVPSKVMIELARDHLAASDLQRSARSWPATSHRSASTAGPCGASRPRVGG